MGRKAAVTLSPSNIKRLRAAIRMTQAQLGGVLDVEEVTVRRWELGMHAPVGNRRRKLQRLLNKYLEADSDN